MILILTTSYPRFPGDYAGIFVAEHASYLAGERALLGSSKPAEKGLGAQNQRSPAPKVTILTPADDIRNRSIEGESTVCVRRVRYAWPRMAQQLFYGFGTPENLARKKWPAVLIPQALFFLSAATWRESTERSYLITHWLLPCGFIGALIKQARPVRHFAFVHSADVSFLERMPFASLIARFLVYGADGFIFVSNALRERFLGLCPQDVRARALRKSVVIPMGIHVADYKAPRVIGEDNRLRLLYLGRLERVKGLDTLLDAMTKDDPVVLTIGGEGSERERLMQLSECRHLPVSFIGRVDTRNVAELMARHDALVLPSRALPSGRTEGSPRILLEGMAAGLVVISTAVGGISHIVEHMRTGILVPPDSPTRLREAIIGLQLDPGLLSELGKAGRKAAEKYDWERIGRLVDEFMLYLCYNK